MTKKTERILLNLQESSKENQDCYLGFVGNKQQAEIRSFMYGTAIDLTSALFNLMADDEDMAAIIVAAAREYVTAVDTSIKGMTVTHVEPETEK